jgi:predicted DCC family thiol-disulfide oxidoreductase YuxK
MNPAWKPLPAADLPEGVILFDGLCVLCSWWVQFVIARDPDAQFRFLAIQSPRGRDFAAQLGIDPDEPQTNAVILSGTAFFKSDAALQILIRLRGWRLSRLGSILPRALRNWFYDRVARNRYDWFGRRTVCLNPASDAVRRHFFE